MKAGDFSHGKRVRVHQIKMSPSCVFIARKNYLTL